MLEENSGWGGFHAFFFLLGRDWIPHVVDGEETGKGWCWTHICLFPDYHRPQCPPHYKPAIVCKESERSPALYLFHSEDFDLSVSMAVSVQVTGDWIQALQSAPMHPSLRLNKLNKRIGRGKPTKTSDSEAYL